MTIYKTKIKKYGLGALLGSAGKLSGTLGKVGDVAQKVAPIASAVGQMLPQKQEEVADPNAGIKSGIKAVAAPALDAVAPGLGQLVGVSDTIGNAIGGKTGEFIKSTNPIDQLVNSTDNLIAGDISGLLESSPLGIAAGAFGVDFGDSRKDKKIREAEINAVTSANKQAKKNNADANLRYTQPKTMVSKEGGSINRFLRASKGLSFKLSLLTQKENEFKVGGVLPSYHTNKNVILAGVLHKDNHSICELEDKSCGVIYGKKGIPVVSNNEKVAEIEKEELVFTKDVAKQIEVLVNKYNKSKSNDVKLELGKYIYEQLNVNTIDNTKI